eukprot:GHVL01006168.1.p1 GENE.GHVL01006168.1~~GHVL01006168.1.p1  ORF type:complete len:506 (+),score=123.97 GHVL01006168.1:1-1518(+)
MLSLIYCINFTEYDIINLNIITRYRLRMNIDILCYNNEHIIYIIISIIGIFIWTVSVVIFTEYLLYHRIDKLQTDTVQRHFGFLYNGYRPEYWWYESIIFLRKFLVQIIVFAIPSNPQAQLALHSIIAVSLLYLNIYLNPYDPRDRGILNILENISLGIWFIISFFLLFITFLDDIYSSTFIYIIFFIIFIYIIIYGWKILVAWASIDDTADSSENQIFVFRWIDRIQGFGKQVIQRVSKIGKSDDKLYISKSSNIYISKKSTSANFEKRSTCTDLDKRSTFKNKISNLSKNIKSSNFENERITLSTSPYQIMSPIRSPIRSPIKNMNSKNMSKSAMDNADSLIDTFTIMGKSMTYQDRNYFCVIINHITDYIIKKLNAPSLVLSTEGFNFLEFILRLSILLKYPKKSLIQLANIDNSEDSELPGMNLIGHLEEADWIILLNEKNDDDSEKIISIENLHTAVLDTMKLLPPRDVLKYFHTFCISSVTSLCFDDPQEEANHSSDSS